MQKSLLEASKKNTFFPFREKNLPMTDPWPIFFIFQPKKNGSHLHPQKLTWNLEMMVSNRNLLFQGSIFRFHVCFAGCKRDYYITHLGGIKQCKCMVILRGFPLYTVDGRILHHLGCMKPVVNNGKKLPTPTG